MLAPGLEQVQVKAQGLPGQGPGLGALGGEHLLGGPVGDVDGVHVVDELHHMAGLHKVGEPAAELGGEVELAVGKGPRAAEAAHGALVQGQHLQAGAVVGQLIGGEDARLAAAQDGNVIDGIHGVSPLSLSSEIAAHGGPYHIRIHYTTVFTPGEGNFSLFPCLSVFFAPDSAAQPAARRPLPPWGMGRNFLRKPVKNWRK